MNSNAVMVTVCASRKWQMCFSFRIFFWMTFLYIPLSPILKI